MVVLNLLQLTSRQCRPFAAAASHTHAHKRLRAQPQACLQPVGPAEHAVQSTVTLSSNAKAAPHGGGVTPEAWLAARGHCCHALDMLGQQRQRQLRRDALVQVQDKEVAGGV